MRISISKIMLFALLLSAGGISAMEYGDIPQQSAVPITSWLYNKITVSQETADHVLPNAVVAAVAVPTLASSKNIALAIAGGALMLSVARKMLNRMNLQTKNGE